MGSQRIRHDWVTFTFTSLSALNNLDQAIVCYSVQFTHSVLSDSFQLQGLQHTRLSITNSQSLLKLMSIESVMPFNHPLLLLPSVFTSIRVFSNESVLCIRWPKYWSFSFNISPSNEYSRLISFRMHWLDLLAVQGTLTSGTVLWPQNDCVPSLPLCLTLHSMYFWH